MNACLKNIFDSEKYNLPLRMSLCRYVCSCRSEWHLAHCTPSSCLTASWSGRRDTILRCNISILELSSCMVCDVVSCVCVCVCVCACVCVCVWRHTILL